MFLLSFYYFFWEDFFITASKDSSETLWTFSLAAAYFRSSRPEVFCKKNVLKNFAIFAGKHLSWDLFLIKLQDFRPAALLKGNLTQVFSCKYCKIFKSTYFQEHLRTGAFKASVNNFPSIILCREDWSFLKLEN